MKTRTGDVVANESTRHAAHEFFGSEAIQQHLQTAGLDSFETIWTLKAEWVEKPNLARQGWSGTARIELKGPALSAMGVYLKRQENHGYRSLRNPFRYQPTAYREYRRLVAMQAVAITTPEILYYGERHTGTKMQAILMTQEIPQSIPLNDYLSRAPDRDPAEVERVLRDTAALIAKLHHHHFQHCALYGKHVLIRGAKSAAHARGQLAPYLIDVEKSRRRLSRLAIAVKDLDQFHRRAPWNTAQWNTFLEYYVGAGRMERLKPILAWLIQKKATRKHARQQPPGIT